jgi:hypothetical protein
MTQVFESKVDGWLRGLMLFSAVLCTVVSAVMLFSGNPAIVLLGILTILAGALLPVWLLRDTRYEVRGDDLLVRCGPFKWHIRISSIESVSETRNPLSSPALSLDRLRVDYDNGRWMMVSPADKSAFRIAIGHPER